MQPSQPSVTPTSIPPTRSINYKISAIILVLFLCYIPTLFIQGVINDRTYYQEITIEGSVISSEQTDMAQRPLENKITDYRALTRATKYAILFITLTFALFFLFEVLAKLKIHPINYGLVGLALGVFYLLLLSLTEVAGFIPAYAIASTATIGLIVMYTHTLLQSTFRSGILAGLLGCLYGYLLVLLQLEQYSLLFGSLLVFATLATIMLTTRKINWYDV
jgi:inner membrane protein involved in colicin E2 resistance